MTEDKSWLYSIFLRKYKPVTRFFIVELFAALFGFTVVILTNGLPKNWNDFYSIFAGIGVGVLFGILTEVFAELAFNAIDANRNLEKSINRLENQANRDQMISQLATHSPFSGVLGTLYADSGGAKVIHNVDRGQYFKYLREAIPFTQDTYETIQHSGIDFFEGREDFFDVFADVEVKCTRIFLVDNIGEISAQEAKSEKWSRYWNRVGPKTHSFWIISSDLDRARTEYANKTATIEKPVSILESTDIVICDRKLLFQYDADTKELIFDHSADGGALPFEWVFDFLVAEKDKPIGSRFKAVSKPDGWQKARHLRFSETKGMIINLQRIQQNLKTITRIKPKDMHLVLVLKSDAYGVGLSHVADYLTKTNRQLFTVGVSTIAEALLVRELSNDLQILLMEGVIAHEVDAVVQNKLQTLVWDIDIVRQLQSEAKQLGTEALVHIKVETGMNRLGIKPSGLSQLLQEIKSSPNVRLVGIGSHLSSGESPQLPITMSQIKTFKKALDMCMTQCGCLPKYIHLGNSSALLSGAGNSFNTIRIGGLLFGLEHPAIRDYASNRFREATFLDCVTVVGRINQIQDIGPGETLSYGARQFPRPNGGKVAITNLGYFDGIPTQFLQNGQALINGFRCNVVGAPHLGMTMFDVTDVESCSPGDQVVFIGKDGGQFIGIGEFAEWCGCHPYEVLCRFGSTLPKQYIES